MEFQTIFEISQFKFQVYFFPLFGVVFITLASLTIRFPEKYIRLQNRKIEFIPPCILEVKIKNTKKLGVTILIFSICWTLLAAGSLLKEQSKLRKAYKVGEFKVVEGYVKDFSPMPYTGHQDEVFSVGGVTFKYSDFAITPAFNNTSSHGGPVENGAYLRISYVNNNIVKLEKRK